MLTFVYLQEAGEDQEGFVNGDFSASNTLSYHDNSSPSNRNSLQVDSVSIATSQNTNNRLVTMATSHSNHSA